MKLRPTIEPELKRIGDGLGWIIWRGPSAIDGSPIVAIAQEETTNRKTGNVLNVWILRDDITPLDALKLGLDNAICGNCPHRPEILEDGTTRRSCYVNPLAPHALWKAYKRGRYLEIGTSRASLRRWAFRHAQGRVIRWGAYGDPHALPYWVLSTVSEVAERWLGYTHQWRTLSARYADYLMASCDTLQDVEDARALGYRTFVVTPDVDTVIATDERIITCPASPEAGARVQCLECRLCDGARGDDDARASIRISAHGTAARYVRERAELVGAFPV
jgi:hypothetical protein